MKLAFRLSAEYESEYRQMVRELYGVPSYRTRHLAAFWPVVRPDHQPGRGWMFVGIATNGWGGRSDDGPWFGRRGAPRLGRIRDFYGWEESDLRQGGCVRVGPWPGAFWTTIKRLCPTRLQDLDEREWKGPRWAAWSNLYKVAPTSERGGANPDEGLRRAQLDFCRSLLRREVREIRPKRVIVLSGASWWADFFRPGTRDLVGAFEDGSSVIRTTFEDVPAVLAPHPQRAQYLGMTMDSLCERILHAAR